MSTFFFYLCVSLCRLFLYYKYMHAYFQIFGNPTRPLTERDLTHPPLLSPPQPSPSFSHPEALTDPSVRNTPPYKALKPHYFLPATIALHPS